MTCKPQNRFANVKGLNTSLCLLNNFDNSMSFMVLFTILGANLILFKWRLIKLNSCAVCEDNKHPLSYSLTTKTPTVYLLLVSMIALNFPRISTGVLLL